MSFHFTRADRILKRTQFLELARGAKRLQNRHFVAIYSPNRLERSRLGLTVTKKVGNAVTRNRVKRISREYFRLSRHIIKGNWDINVIAKKEAAKISSDEAFSSLKNIFSRIS